jgi:carbamoyl-phosphate synthase large subunit
MSVFKEELDKMNTVVLVSGASGIVGYGILNALRKANMPLKLIGTTIYSDSVAQGFCDIFEQALPTQHPQYLEWLINTIHKHQVDFIIPGIEDDLFMWAKHIDLISSSNCKVLMNNLDLVKLCKDKWLFFKHLAPLVPSHVIPSLLSNSFQELVEMFGLPFIVKPRRGFGSKGIFYIKNEKEFNHIKDNMGHTLMAQQIVGDNNEEYSVSAFGDGKGGYLAYMSIKRKLSKDGYTDRAETIEPQDIQIVLKTLCEIFKPIGPTNFQFRLHEEMLKLLEINPRISSATSIRTSFGYNESLMALNYFIYNQLPSQPIVKKGKAVRYVTEKIFLDESYNI